MKCEIDTKFDREVLCEQEAGVNRTLFNSEDENVMRNLNLLLQQCEENWL